MYIYVCKLNLDLFVVISEFTEIFQNANLYMDDLPKMAILLYDWRDTDQIQTRYRTFFGDNET